MIRLGYDAHYFVTKAIRDKKTRVEEERSIAMRLVIGHCHPGNLGQLPPSPRVLEHKAWLLGLL